MLQTEDRGDAWKRLWERSEYNAHVIMYYGSVYQAGERIDSSKLVGGWYGKIDPGREEFEKMM